MSAMHLLRFIAKQKRLGFGVGEALLAGFNGRSMCMVVAFEEDALDTAMPAGVTQATKNMPFWLPSLTRRPSVASLMLSQKFKDKINQPAFKIDGKAVADEIKRSLAQEVKWMKDEKGAVPGLAMVRVGDRKDSELYIRGKQAACAEVGIDSYVTHLPKSASEAEILEVIRKFNSDNRVHGILVQLPLPNHIQQENVLQGVKLEKDVDGLHPVNLGRLAGLGKAEPTFVPCTPLGCLELLIQHGIDVENKHAVVIGCSSVVGFPTAILLQKYKARVTVIQVDTPNPVEITKQADIVIAATGVPGLVRGNWLKPGAIVIDVGTTAVEDPKMESGFRVIGDVCFEEAETVAAAITPVPGGVGPMTIAMLLSNTVKAAQQSFGLTHG